MFTTILKDDRTETEQFFYIAPIVEAIGESISLKLRVTAQ